MKTTTIKNTLASATLAFLLAGPLLTQIQAGPGVDYWRKMRPITTEKEAKALPEDCAMAMVCPMCKNVTMSTPKSQVGRAGQGVPMPMTMGAQSSCESCGGTVTVAKGKEEGSMKMNCSKCGEGAAFCCAADSKS